MTPVASIVIPTYNQRKEYLEAAVASALGQTVPVEVIVVDDGSDTPISSEGAPPNARVLNLPQNMGIATALNAGIAAMQTDWFCWLSSDDLIVPHKVAVQLRLTQEAGAHASFHRWKLHGTDPRTMLVSETISWRSWRVQRRELATCCKINGSTVMIHRSVFDEVGLFDAAFRYGQDWDFWNRVTHRYEWLFVSDILGERREGENLTERIKHDEAMRARRDEEDMTIRAKYLPLCQ